jgi:hypothetical protein
MERKTTMQRRQSTSVKKALIVLSGLKGQPLFALMVGLANRSILNGKIKF